MRIGFLLNSLPLQRSTDMNTTDRAATLANFLGTATGTVFGVWEGKMPAVEQRRLFGTFFGKGRITINGETETVSHTVRVCFGTDYNTTSTAWRNL